WLAAGAGLAASVAVAVGIASWPPAPIETYATAAGQTRQLTLADGSKVWLNANSRMDVRFERRARRIQMAEGEAAFDVTHDPHRPFLIDTGDHEVRVVGTEFNLRQRAGDFALTVRRGVVEVRPSGAPNTAPTRVAAGQRLTHKGGAPAASLTATLPDAAFAWTHGQLVYSDAPLDEVAMDLSRSLGTPIRIADPAAGRIRFTGVLTLDDTDAVLRRLEAFAPVRAERGAQGVVLRPR
ncbi:MAG TPA: FecR domain-containing protein, partial [Phenylobacterium sp.]